MRDLRARVAERAVAALRGFVRRFELTRRLRLRLRDAVARSGPPDSQAVRDDLAFRYLRGDGIEIGALHLPVRLPPGARVTYVDRAGVDELRTNHPQLIEYGWPLVEPDVIDDAETLAKFDDESVDFVVANHVLEHFEDPIAGLTTFLRVLRPGGILYLTLPDARRSFDSRRPRTTPEHLMRDHREGPEVSRREHYEEWARFIDSVPEERVPARADEFAAEGAQHHFHVWELDTFVAFVAAVGLPVDVEAAIATEEEFAAILRKNPGKRWFGDSQARLR